MSAELNLKDTRSKESIILRCYAVTCWDKIWKASEAVGRVLTSQLEQLKTRLPKIRNPVDKSLQRKFKKGDIKLTPPEIMLAQRWATLRVDYVVAQIIKCIDMAIQEVSIAEKGKKGRAKCVARTNFGKQVAEHLPLCEHVKDRLTIIRLLWLVSGLYESDASPEDNTLDDVVAKAERYLGPIRKHAKLHGRH